MDRAKVSSVAVLRERVAKARARGKRIGFVPTMGALHAGHLSLVSQAVHECDFVVVSIFVNPLQFGPTEDLNRYPQTLAADMEQLTALDVDVVFVPSVEEMYPQPQLAFVEVEHLTQGLCGASRPGHFRGVATVVAKLFNMVQPDVAYFGQKDAQQAAVIKRMVRDLAYPIVIRLGPTVREDDGLALSSRNAYLNEAERAAATVLYRALQEGSRAVSHGETAGDAVALVMQKTVAQEPLARVDYVAVVDADTLEPVQYIQQRVLLAMAVYIGSTRLIDNVLASPPSQ